MLFMFKSEKTVLNNLRKSIESKFKNKNSVFKYHKYIFKTHFCLLIEPECSILLMPESTL
jgi:hypothetical protein